MKRSTLIGISVFSVLLLSGLGVGIYFLLRSDETNEARKGAVASSTDECTDVAVVILNKGGSAVDAAITAALCQGLTVPQSSGLGGGFLATIYIKETGTIETLNAREVAPINAFKNMYKDDISSREGGLAVAVPTELKGLHELHKKHGKLTWREVVQPVIDVAEQGYKVTPYLASIFKSPSRTDKIRNKPGFRELFVNPKTGELWEEGDVIKNPKLANTFKIIAEEGADAFYSKSGTFTQKIVDELNSDGGIFTIDDMINYKPKWGSPVASKLFNGENLYTFPLPATGHVINLIINILNGYGIQNDSFEFHNEEKLLYHRLVESFKFGFAKRTTLGDELSDEVLKTLQELESLEFANSIREKINDDKTFNDFAHYGANNSVVVDHGTGHLSILAPNGDAVAFTSTINLIMGAYLMSNSTGILYNNEMNDFSIPVADSDGLLPSPANFISPGKSPISSMSPIIVLNDQKEVSLVLGGAGGILIMTSMIQFLINYLYLNQSIETSLAMKRLHHQLQPMYVTYEAGYDEDILRFLESKEHVTEESPPIISGFASVIVIANKNGKVEAAIDPRRGGKVTIVG